MRSGRESPAESTMWLCRKSGASLPRAAGVGDGDPKGELPNTGCSPLFHTRERPLGQSLFDTITFRKEKIAKSFVVSKFLRIFATEIDIIAYG